MAVHLDSLTADLKKLCRTVVMMDDISIVVPEKKEDAEAEKANDSEQEVDRKDGSLQRQLDILARVVFNLKKAIGGSEGKPYPTIVTTDTLPACLEDIRCRERDGECPPTKPCEGE